MSPEEFKALLKEKVAENRVTFEGAYGPQLNALLGLSKSEIDALTPGTTDLKTYDDLITLVKEASKANIQQAQLKEQIEELGDIAKQIAEKVPGLIS